LHQLRKSGIASTSLPTEIPANNLFTLYLPIKILYLQKNDLPDIAGAGLSLLANRTIPVWAVPMVWLAWLLYGGCAVYRWHHRFDSSYRQNLPTSSSWNVDMWFWVVFGAGVFDSYKWPSLCSTALRTQKYDAASECANK